MEISKHVVLGHLIIIVHVCVPRQRKQDTLVLRLCDCGMYMYVDVV